MYKKMRNSQHDIEWVASTPVSKSFIAWKYKEYTHKLIDHQKKIDIENTDF